MIAPLVSHYKRLFSHKKDDSATMSIYVGEDEWEEYSCNRPSVVAHLFVMILSIVNNVHSLFCLIGRE